MFHLSTLKRPKRLARGAAGVPAAVESHDRVEEVVVRSTRGIEGGER